MPRPHAKQQALNELVVVLRGLADGHTRLTPEQGLAMKARLFTIMADEHGWATDPDSMTVRFREAMDGR